MAAFDARDVFADGVDLVDGGAAGEQEPRGGLLLFERDAFGGQREQGGGAAGDEADDEVVAARTGGDFGDAGGALDAARVGDRMAALVEFDAAEPGEVAVLDVDESGGDALAEDAFRGQRHGSAGLPRPDHVDVAVAVVLTA